MRAIFGSKYLIAVILCLFLFNGCALFVIGAAGGAAGYAMSPDGVEGISDKTYDKVWSASNGILKQQGTVEVTDKEHGKMTAKVDDSTVQFTLQQATPHSVIIRVQARKVANMFPDKNLAKRLYDLIVADIGPSAVHERS